MGTLIATTPNHIFNTSVFRFTNMFYTRNTVSRLTEFPASPLSSAPSLHRLSSLIGGSPAASEPNVFYVLQLSKLQQVIQTIEQALPATGWSAEIASAMTRPSSARLSRHSFSLSKGNQDKELLEV